MKLKKWDEIRANINKDKWYIVSFILIGYFGFLMNSEFMIAISIVALVAEAFFVLLKFDGKAKKYKNIILSIICYGAGLSCLLYGIAKLFIDALPDGIFGSTSSYIVFGILTILMLLYMDFIRPKEKSEEKKN